MLSNCILWAGTMRRDGYGLVTVDGRQRRAHRVAWEAVNGPIPDGMLVCHQCDVRNCVNVEHLFLGTPKTNSMDMVSKFRGPKTKMTASSLARVREMLAHGARQVDIATAVGLTQSSVSKIKRRQTFKAV